jgi:hypothetical protein
LALEASEMHVDEASECVTVQLVDVAAIADIFCARGADVAAVRCEGSQS